MNTRGVIACLFVVTVFIALAWRVPDVIDRPLLPGVPGISVGVPLPFRRHRGHRESPRHHVARA